MEDELVSAVEEVLKIESSNKSNQRFTYEWELLQEILGAVLAWPFGAKGLVDKSNWNLERLKHSGYISGYRKPKAYFDIFITSKDNLAMDWYPVKDRSIFPDFRTMDWKRWDHEWPIGGGNYKLPFNRVFMIRNIKLVNSRINKKRMLPETGEKIIYVVNNLIDYVYRYLKEFVDVIELTKFKMNYDEKKNKQGSTDRIFTGFYIIDQRKKKLI